jgi:Mlc titration factor MtfA (ptsG expression regulator)
MQVIYKIDKIFIFIFSFIILIIGLVGAISFRNFLFFLFMAMVEFFYLFFSLKRYFRRLKAIKAEFPEAWRTILSIHSSLYRNLCEPNKTRFEKDIQIILSDYSIEGIKGRRINIETKILVASSVATMLNGRPYWEPPILDGIVIYPGHSFNRHFQPGKGNYAGLASYRGPMILTEGALEESTKHPNDGFNVVIHELAHYFDMEDGKAEGIPSARLSFKKISKWKKMISKEWQRAFQQRSFLRDYAGTNEAEFFAVVTESFFEKPWEVKQKNPELYDTLKDFFNLDTAHIIKETR